MNAMHMSMESGDRRFVLVGTASAAARSYAYLIILAALPACAHESLSIAGFDAPILQRGSEIKQEPEDGLINLLIWADYGAPGIFDSNGRVWLLLHLRPCAGDSRCVVPVTKALVTSLGHSGYGGECAVRATYATGEVVIDLEDGTVLRGAIRAEVRGDSSCLLYGTRLDFSFSARKETSMTYPAPK